MLVELAVENFALVEKVRLSFGAGLNLLTGETGAGKSILLDALGMVLGERATGDLVRHGCERARVEAAFQIEQPEPRLQAVLEATGIEPEEGLLILTRELSTSGKSHARVNGRPVTVGTLKTLGDALVDIHGQHEHQSLLATERHADLLDLWAGPEVQKRKAAVGEAYAAARAARNEWEALLADARERARTLDLLSYQRGEIEAAAPREGEDEVLAAERLRLASAERLHAAAAHAYTALREGGGAIEALGSAVAEIERASRLDPSLSGLLETLQTSLYAVDEAARDLRSYRDSVEFQPERLEEIEARLDTLRTLQRKYGETLADVLAYQREISERLETLENAEERLGALETATKEAEAQLKMRCAALTEARKKAAIPFSKAIQTELKDLAMSATRLSVSIEPKEPGPSGADAIELLISPNPGEPLRPLARIASGGELSRVMLALKSVMARNIAPPVMVFDEIDAGIGGRTGTVLAEKLSALAERAQTLCITHLPQIAAKGSAHFFIEKRVEGKRTSVHVVPLEGEARIAELARMLGGDATDAVLQHARELLG